MEGYVDDDRRALLEVKLGASSGGSKKSISVWVDTAFNGGLVIPQTDIENLGLQVTSSTTAVLADGQQVELPTYSAYLEWFGNEYRTQVVGNAGANPLLGTQLLDGRDLTVSYKQSTLSLV